MRTKVMKGQLVQEWLLGLKRTQRGHEVHQTRWWVRHPLWLQMQTICSPQCGWEQKMAVSMCIIAVTISALKRAKWIYSMGHLFTALCEYIQHWYITCTACRVETCYTFHISRVTWGCCIPLLSRVAEFTNTDWRCWRVSSSVMVQIISLLFPSLILFVCYKSWQTCNLNQVIFLNGPLFNLGEIKKNIMKSFMICFIHYMGYVAWIGAYCKFYLKNLKEETTSGDIGIDRMIIWKCIFEGKVMKCGVDSLDTR